MGYPMKLINHTIIYPYKYRNIFKILMKNIGFEEIWNEQIINFMSKNNWEVNYMSIYRGYKESLHKSERIHVEGNLYATNIWLIIDDWVNIKLFY